MQNDYKKQKADDKMPLWDYKMEISDYKKQKKYRAVAKNQKSKRNENSDADYKEAEFWSGKLQKAIRILLQISGGFEIWWRFQKSGQKTKGQITTWEMKCPSMWK